MTNPPAKKKMHSTERTQLGREKLTTIEDGQTDTDLEKHYTVHEDGRTLRFPHWDSSTNKPLLPIDVVETDDGGQVTETYTVDPARTAQS
ncbi:MAG: hypothetical protein JXO22_08695, partial [Phycisphaerae bacterium]|nr:hypothetical protein [Phycisphaerae bacterium]